MNEDKVTRIRRFTDAANRRAAQLQEVFRALENTGRFPCHTPGTGKSGEAQAAEKTKTTRAGWLVMEMIWARANVYCSGSVATRSERRARTITQAIIAW